MTTPIARLRPLVGGLITLSLIVFGVPWSTGHVASAQEQQLFLSVTDADGEPVTDLTLDELLVKWDDQDCETLNLEPIDWPVRITIFVDNGADSRDALQNMREGLKLFMDEIPEGVEIALATISGRARFVTEHTSDKADLLRGIDLMVPDAGAGRFRDALVEEAKRLEDDDERQYFPVIVMVGNDGAEGSTSQQNAYDEMVQRMVAASATVHSQLFTVRGSGQQVAIAMNLSEATQGSYEALAVSTGFRNMLPALGTEIARKHRLVSNQYRVTYAPPDGMTSPSEMGISTSREGIFLTPTLDGNVQ